MANVTMEYSESRGTWNVFVDFEWYYEGTYEQAERILESFYWEDEDEYEEPYDYPDFE